MAVITLGPRKVFEPLPTGDYRLTLVSYSMESRKPDQWHKTDYVNIEFQWKVAVPGKEATQRKSDAPVPETFSEKSRLVQIIVALGVIDSAKAAADGCAIDLDKAIGHSCVGTIVRKLKEDGKSWTDQITAFSPMNANGSPMLGLPGLDVEPTKLIAEDQF
jgi:hypothetical protein